jgi:hypothetical protein
MNSAAHTSQRGSHIVIASPIYYETALPPDIIDSICRRAFA